MSSVNLIQFTEPRLQPSSSGPAPDGDPFGEILESVAVARPADTDARGRADTDAREREASRTKPSAPRSRSEMRSEALTRNDVSAAMIDGGRDDASVAGSTEQEPAVASDGQTAAAATDTNEIPKQTGESADLTVPTEDAEAPAETVTAAGTETEQEAPVVDAVLSENEDGGEKTDAESGDGEAKPVETAEVETAVQTPVEIPVETTAEKPVMQSEAPSTASSIAPVTAQDALAGADDGVPAPVSPAGAVKPESGNAAATTSQAGQLRAATPSSDQPQVPQAAQNAAAPAAAATEESPTPFQDSAGEQLPQKQQDTPLAQAKPQDAKPAPQVEAAKPATPVLEAASPKPQHDSLPEPIRALAASLNPSSVNAMTMRAASLNERAPVPLTGTALAAEIVSRVRDGVRRFDIRLDPPELGRVDVRMEVDRAGNVKTHMTVDRPETLDLMQREARGLERALQQAGLKTDGSGLEFSLRSHADHPQADGQPGRGGREADMFADEGGERIEAVIEGYRSAALARGGVDIRI